MASFAVKAIDHVVLTVKSIPKTVDFYTTRLVLRRGVMLDERLTFEMIAWECDMKFSHRKDLSGGLFLRSSNALSSTDTPKDTPSCSADKSSIYINPVRNSSPRRAKYNAAVKISASSPIIQWTKCSRSGNPLALRCIPALRTLASSTSADHRCRY